MFFAVSLTLLLVVPLEARAQQARILKVKGQQAIVQFPPGTKPQVGQMLDVGSDATVGMNAGSAGAGARDNSIGVATELSFKNNSSSSKTTTAFSLAARYGWNMVDWEIGPSGLLSYRSIDGISATAFGIGGFFDYNLVPNVPGTEMVYGVGTEVSFLSSSTSTSSVSTTVIDLFVGGFLKYFALKNTVALRGDAGLEYDRTGRSNTSTTDANTGLVIKGGLQVYF